MSGAIGGVTQTGTFSGAGGNGTFTRTTQSQGKTRTTDTTLTRADGSRVTRDVTRTRTATGFTRTVATTLPDGKTTTLAETGTKQADGGYAISGTFTGENGKTQQVSGTSVEQGADLDTSLTFSNGAGRARTLDTSFAHSQSGYSVTSTGTTFGGASFDRTTAFAILESQQVDKNALSA